MKNKIAVHAKHIELLALDVDGVLTDGSLYYGLDGETIKKFHVHDGAGIKAVLENGIKVVVISSRETQIVSNRMNELGVLDVLQGITDKLSTLNDFIEKIGIELNAVAYMGDDITDLSIMQNVGLAITVKDGQEIVKQNAHYCTMAKGGHGAVREVCNLLLMGR